MGRADCPGREPDCLKPAGTWEGVSTHMYDLNSPGDRAKEGRGSERRHAGTGEGISARIHVVNSHGDRAEEGRRSEGQHCRRRRRSRWRAQGFIGCFKRGKRRHVRKARVYSKRGRHSTHCTLGRYPKRLYPAKRGFFILHRVTKPAKV